MRGRKPVIEQPCAADGCTNVVISNMPWARFCSSTCKERARFRRNPGDSRERNMRSYYGWSSDRRTKTIARSKLGLADKRAYVRQLKESEPCIDCGHYWPSFVMDYDHVRGEKYRSKTGKAMSVGAMLTAGYA